jgi:hypothetical protein
MSRVLVALMMLALTTPSAFAQETTAKPKPAESKSVEPVRPPSEGEAVNARIELTITDARGEGAPITKTVTLMTADRAWGRIRTQGEARTANGQRFPVILNVDARPTLVSSNGTWNRARVELTIEYRPADRPINTVAPITTTRRDTESVTPNINESLTVILEDGKPLLISQSADPVTDRKVKVEARITILK